MYLVPMDIPKYCNKCPFGMGNYNLPFWGERFISNIDFKENKVGTYGYVCNVEFQKNKRYTKVLRAELGEDIKKPKWCELKETN